MLYRQVPLESSLLQQAMEVVEARESLDRRSPRCPGKKASPGHEGTLSSTTNQSCYDKDDF